MKLLEHIKSNKYVLEFSTPSRKLHPFILETVGGAGDLDFAGTISWLVRVSGTSETVTMALYRVDTSESGNTVTKTLVQKVSRTYKVVCNKHECIIMLTLKRLLGLCNCE